MESEVHTLLQTTIKIEALSNTVEFKELIDSCEALIDSNEADLLEAETCLVAYGYVLPDDSKARITKIEEAAARNSPCVESQADGTISPAARSQQSSPTGGRLLNQTHSAATPEPVQNSHLLSIPATPTLEDFGISASALASLAERPVETVQQLQVKNCAAEESPSVPSIGAPCSTGLSTKRSMSRSVAQEETSAKRAKPEEDALDDPTCCLSASTALLFQQHTERVVLEELKAPELTCELPQLTAECSDTPEGTLTGGTLFPTVESVEQREYDAVAQYLRSMFPLEKLNECIKKINDFMMDRRFDAMDGQAEADDHYDCVTQIILADELGYGDTAAPLFHLLKNLKRFSLHKRMPDATQNL